VEYRKFLQSGRFLLLIVSAAMLIFFTITAILLFQREGAPDNERILALGLGIVLMVLGCGGMGVLLYWGKRSENRLAYLEDLTLPLAKKDYPALAALASSTSTDSMLTGNADTEAYAEFKKAEGELGLFIQAFKTHALGIVEIETHFRKAASVLASEDKGIAEILKELGSSIDKVEAALHEVENVYSAAACVKNPAKVLESAQQHQAEQSDQCMTELFDESGKLLGKLKVQIDNGQDQAQTTYAAIKEASKEFKKITEIADVLNKIAEQSNILSMNAAIESAHAGASGAGFAVVADEIRKLADSTRENASSIQSVLRLITHEISDALQASETSSETFGTLNTAVESFSRSLDAARESAGKVLYDDKESFDTAPILQTIDQASPAKSDLKNIKALLKDLGTLCTKAKVRDEELHKASTQFRSDLKVSLETFRDYLKEAEKLDHILSGDIKNEAMSVPTSTIDGTASAESTEHALPPKMDHIDNSWRKDVAVKTPPKTVY